LAEGIAGDTGVILAIIGLANIMPHVMTPTILNLMPLLCAGFSILLMGRQPVTDTEYGPPVTATGGASAINPEKPQIIMNSCDRIGRDGQGYFLFCNCQSGIHMHLLSFFVCTFLTSKVKPPILETVSEI